MSPEPRYFGQTKAEVDQIARAVRAASVGMDAATVIIAMAEIIADLVIDGHIPDLELAIELIDDSSRRGLFDKQVDVKAAAHTSQVPA